MSTINVATLRADSVIGSSNVRVGAAVSINRNDNISVGSDVFVNSSFISVGNSTVNTQVNTTAISTSGLTIDSVFYNTVPDENVNAQIFTTTGWSTWTKPSWATTGNVMVQIIAWGAGSAGVSAIPAGGGGGACIMQTLNASQCNAICNVFVGSGGATVGAAGQSSTFHPTTSLTITAYGGGPNSTNEGGSGGGWSSAGLSSGAGGAPLGGAIAAASSPGNDSTFGGGSCAKGTSNGGSSIYGGAGGGRQTGNGGNTIYGGGGGAGGSTGSLSGVSIFGGNGASPTVAASAPGGAGSGNTATIAGARGEVRIYTYRL